MDKKGGDYTGEPGINMPPAHRHLGPRSRPDGKTSQINLTSGPLANFAQDQDFSGFRNLIMPFLGQSIHYPWLGSG